MHSPLSRLCEVLKLVKSSAENYREQLQKNEAVTRAVLVDPILMALGWDLANPGMVEVEKQAGASGRFDYFLNGETPVVVEAKKLGEPLDNHFMQIVSYAFSQGVAVSSVFLTDGMKWLHYTNLSQTNREPAHKIDLATCDDLELTRAASYFVESLDAALIAPPVQKVEDKIDELERKYNELERIVKLLGQDKQIALDSPPASEVEDVQWHVIGDSWDAMKKKPVKLRLPDGKVLEIRSWKNVLMETCEYCLTVEPRLLQQLPIPDRNNRATKLINTIKPPSNLNSGSFSINDREVHVCANYSANDCVANAAYMLSKLGSTPIKAAVLLAE